VRDEPPPRPDNDRANDPLGIDTTHAHPARIQSYLAGGDAHFAIDREVADYLNRTSPSSDDADLDVEIGRAGVQLESAFVARAVRYLAVDAKVRQFLSVGATVPMLNVHEIAQRAAPESRVVYIGRDPVVLAHAHTLRATPDGATAFVYGGLRDPEKLLRSAAETLDLSRPVALLLISVLNLFDDDRDPYGIVTQLMKAVPSGSHLVVAHPTGDFWPEGGAAIADHLSNQMQRPYILRSRAEIARFFDGLELLDGGVVHISEWRRSDDEPLPPAKDLVGVYGAVGRKP
jgi:hypothetical protein